MRKSYQTRMDLQLSSFPTHLINSPSLPDLSTSEMNRLVSSSTVFHQHQLITSG